MSEQLDFTDEAYARRTDPDTSHKAAREVKANQYERMVLKALKLGPATIRDIEFRTGVHYGTISPRFAPLVKRGYIEIIEKRGRRQVYGLTPEGRNV